MEPNVIFSQNQIQRMIGKYFKKSKLSIFVVCPLRFEEILSAELLELGINSKIDLGGVHVQCTWGNMMLINYVSRVATKVLLRVEDGYANSYPELYDKLRRIPLLMYQGNHGCFTISVSSSESRLHHTDNIANTFWSVLKEKLNSKIVMQKESGQGIDYHLRFDKDRFQLSVNVSGKPLYMRGYKTEGGKATIRENIASALLYLVKAKESDFFMDAFCGSGTFLFEYYLQKMNIAPGFMRSFGFEKLPMFNKKSYDRLKSQIDSQVVQPSFKILGSDNNELAVERCRSVAKKLMPEDTYEISCLSFQDSIDKIPKLTKGCIVSNLPYGKRIHEKIPYADLEQFNIALKKKGFSRGFLTIEGTPTLLRKELKFKNGGVSVKYFYED